MADAASDAPHRASQPESPLPEHARIGFVRGDRGNVVAFDQAATNRLTKAIDELLLSTEREKLNHLQPK